MQYLNELMRTTLILPWDVQLIKDRKSSHSAVCFHTKISVVSIYLLNDLGSKQTRLVEEANIFEHNL